MNSVEFGRHTAVPRPHGTAPVLDTTNASAVTLTIDGLSGQSSLAILQALALMTPTHEQGAESLCGFIERACAQLLSNALASHWSGKQLLAVLPAARNAAKLGCLNAVADLSIALLQSPSLRKGDECYFAAVVEMYIDNVRERSGADAESLELEILRTTPRFECHRSPPWAPHRPGATRNTQEFAKRALPYLSGRQRLKFLDICDFDWLDLDDIKATLLSRPTPERGNRFSNCTKEVARGLYLHIEQGGRLLAQYLPCLSRVAGWKEFLEDEFLLVPLFQCDPLKESAGSGTAVWTSLLALAEQCKAPLRARLMEEMVKYTILSYLAKSRASGLLSRDVGDLFQVLWHAVRHGASIQRIRERLLSMRILGSPRLNPESMPLVHDSGAMDESISSLVHHGIPCETVNQFRSAMVECGLLSIGSVRNLPSDADILSAALRSAPSRLAEVSSLQLFVELARKFEIPVRLPEYEVADAAAAVDKLDSSPLHLCAPDAAGWVSMDDRHQSTRLSTEAQLSDFAELDLNALDAADRLNGVRRNGKAQLRTRRIGLEATPRG